MKMKQAIEIRSARRVYRDTVGCEPVFVEPYIDQQHGDESREIENILFDWNPSAKRWGRNAQSRVGIRERKETVRKEVIENHAQREQQRYRAPEGFSRDANSLARQKPDADREDGHNEQREA